MKKILLCCFSLVLMYPLGIDLYLVGLPQIATSLQATEADLHAAFSIYLVGMASTMIFGGLLADKCGRKPVAILSAIIFTLASWWTMQATNPLQFFIGRFGQGIGSGFAYVVAFAILRDVLDDDKRAKVLSMINGITCIIPVLAPVIGHLILLVSPWPILFMVMMITAVLIGLACCFALTETRSVSHHKSDSVPWQKFLSRFFLSRLFILSLSVSAILTYVNTSPMLMMDIMGFSTGQYSMAMALLAVVSMTTAFLTPKMLVLLGQHRVMVASQCLFLLSGIQLVIAGITSNPLLFLTGFAFICSGFSLGFGTTTSQALKPFDTHAGLASSVLGISQITVSAFYIWFMGWLGVNALNMLTILLFVTSLGNLAALLTSRSPKTAVVTQAVTSDNVA
ncbi:multidrug transporter subunit MdtL [Photobacterium proteolyticum]|uniref:Multidrug transporter subunit MdtL n=1 Tax=Photobacterium proteolyticum TaxID=1903952 RepID=A0A1Q9GA03_9GAMM|nr:MFS transporter [Photobacterium proteolyticum]OLQ71164.1 multidrug transporter subunit MdtL [Photobacterium proteolyticum]